MKSIPQLIFAYRLAHILGEKGRDSNYLEQTLVTTRISFDFQHTKEGKNVSTEWDLQIQPSSSYSVGLYGIELSLGSE